MSDPEPNLEPGPDAECPVEPEGGWADPDIVAVTDVTLNTWCENKSHALGRRVEALSAFHKKSTLAGDLRSSSETFEADFQAFLLLTE
jgi:hypothetical protein